MRASTNIKSGHLFDVKLSFRLCALVFCIFAYLWRANQQCLNKAFGLGTSATPGSVVEVVSTVDHRVLSLVFFLAILIWIERTDLREQDEGDDSDRPHVGCGGEWLKLDLLW